jgi:hypothetical protein
MKAEWPRNDLNENREGRAADWGVVLGQVVSAREANPVVAIDLRKRPPDRGGAGAFGLRAEKTDAG